MFFAKTIEIYAESNSVDSLLTIIDSSNKEEEKFEALLLVYAELKDQDLEQAELYGKKALELAKEMKDEVREARAIKDMGKRYIQTYEFEKFDSIMTYAATIFERNNENILYASCINNLGASQYYRGNLLEAEKYFRQSRDYYDSESWEYLTTNYNIAAIMQTQGRFSESLKILAPLGKKFHEYGDDYYYANCLVLTANVFDNQGDNKKAKEYNNLYVNKCKEIGFNDGIAGGYLNLAQLYYEEKSYNKSLENAQLAKSIFKSIPNDYQLSNTKIFIGVIYKDLGQFSEAEKENKEAFRIADKKGFTNHISTIYNNNSNLLLIKKRYSQAKDMAIKSFKIASDAQDYNMMRDAAFNISEANKYLGNYKNALKYFEIHTQYKDSVAIAQNTQEIQALKMNFEITTKEFENSKLLNENKLKQLKIEQQKSKIFIVGVILFLVLAIVAILILLNKKLRIKNQVISLQKDDLKKSNRLKDNMFSIIAHDLRGPLGNVNGLLGFLDYEVSQGNKNEFDNILETVKEASSSTYVLLENLLTWARQQKNEIVFQPNVQSINDLVNEVVQLKIPAAENKSIALKNYLKENIMCEFDYDMINLVIRNLVDNAIKFTPDGGKVGINGVIYNRELKISISDSGVGIAEDVKQKIFNKYEHYTSIGTQKEKGSGLGLKLCHEFVIRHSGQIWIESSEGNGSIFSFTIPVN